MIASSSSLAAFSQALGRDMPIEPLRPNIVVGPAKPGGLKPWVEDFWSELQVQGKSASLPPFSSCPTASLAPSLTLDTCSHFPHHLQLRAVHLAQHRLRHGQAARGNRLAAAVRPPLTVLVSRTCRAPELTLASCRALAKDRRVDSGSYSPVFVRPLALPPLALAPPCPRPDLAPLRTGSLRLLDRRRCAASSPRAAPCTTLG